MASSSSIAPPSESYLKQIFQEFLEKRNILVVMAKGLGIQLLFVKLIRLYCIREPESSNKAKAKEKEKEQRSGNKLYIVLNASSCSKSESSCFSIDGQLAICQM